jgi:hypothetical protein
MFYDAHWIQDIKPYKVDGDRSGGGRGGGGEERAMTWRRVWVIYWLLASNSVRGEEREEARGEERVDWSESESTVKQ